MDSEMLQVVAGLVGAALVVLAAVACVHVVKISMYVRSGGKLQAVQESEPQPPRPDAVPGAAARDTLNG